MFSKQESSVKKDFEVPEHLICPISYLIFLEPIRVLPSGKIYEKEFIQALEKAATEKGKKLLCPSTYTPIESYSNALDIELEVQNYLKINPNALNQLYIREKPSEYYSLKLEGNNPESKQEEKAIEIQDADLLKQITDDELLAQRLSEEFSMEDRHRKELEKSYYQVQESSSSSSSSSSQNRRSTQHSLFNRHEPSKSYLPLEESRKRDQLIDEVQNLIYALGFEPGPKPQGKIQNFTLLFFAIIESAFLEPLPWQKIKVNPGPKSETMYIILKTAITALNEASLDRLTPVKTHLAGEYDKVRTWFGGDCSLSSTYGSIAKTVGTISNQPGDLVRQKITEVEEFLKEVELQALHSAHFS